MVPNEDLQVIHQMLEQLDEVKKDVHSIRDAVSSLPMLEDAPAPVVQIRYSLNLRNPK